MDSEFYREFIAIVETSNFAEAAELLSISTSTISRHLRAAEDELGVELFSRTSRSVQLNEFGERFLPFARKMVRQYDDFMAELKAFAEEKQNTVYYTGNYQFNSTILRFRMQYPQYHLRKRPRKGLSFVDALEERCDIAVLLGTKDPTLADANIESVAQEALRDERLERIVLGTDTLAVAVNQSSPFAQKKSVDLGEIKDIPFVALSSNDTGEPILTPFTNLGLQPKLACMVSTGEEALALVAEGQGFTILMRQLAERAARDNIRLLEIKGGNTYNIYLCRIKGKKLSPAAEAFWNFVQQGKER